MTNSLGFSKSLFWRTEGLSNCVPSCTLPSLSLSIGFGSKVAVLLKALRTILGRTFAETSPPPTAPETIPPSPRLSIEKTPRSLKTSQDLVFLPFLLRFDFVFFLRLDAISNSELLKFITTPNGHQEYRNKKPFL